MNEYLIYSNRITEEYSCVVLEDKKTYVIVQVFDGGKKRAHNVLPKTMFDKDEAIELARKESKTWEKEKS